MTEHLRGWAQGPFSGSKKKQKSEASGEFSGFKSLKIVLIPRGLPALGEALGSRRKFASGWREQ